jgi:hypothetical protein
LDRNKVRCWSRKETRWHLNLATESLPSNTKVGAGGKDDPAEVARQGSDAVMADKARVVVGAFKNPGSEDAAIKVVLEP